MENLHGDNICTTLFLWFLFHMHKFWLKTHLLGKDLIQTLKKKHEHLKKEHELLWESSKYNLEQYVAVTSDVSALLNSN